MQQPTRTRGIATIPDVRARSILDPLTGCWHWQGAKAWDGVPRIHAFDHARGEKRVMCGPQAVWNIAHGESPAPKLAFRACTCTDCVNPVHLRLARDKAEIGLHIRRRGNRKGKALEARRANARLAQIAAGHTPTPPEVVMAVRSAPAVVTNRELAALHGITDKVVSRIRRGESHRHLLEATT
jgi:hypothetical protein